MTEKRIYTGKEWKEKWRNDPDLKGLRMREEPADWERIDQNGTPVDPIGKLLTWVFLILFISVIAVGLLKLVGV